MDSQPTKKNVTVNFGAALSNKNVGEEFRNYLLTEHNNEPYDFLMEVNKLKETQSKEKVVKAKSIVETYLKDKSDCEINIDGSTKYQVLKEFEEAITDDECLSEKPIENIFEKLVNIVKDELYHDSWKRFLRSKFAQKIISKFQNDPSVCSPQVVEYWNYTDEYFTHGLIEDRDFEFAKTLFEDNFDWNLIKNKKGTTGTNSYYSFLNYLPKLTYSQHICCLKNEFVLPYNLERILISNVPSYNSNVADPNITRYQMLEDIPYEKIVEHYKSKGEEQKVEKCQTGQVISSIDLTFGFPLSPRYYLAGVKQYYEKESNTFFTISKPFIKEGTEFLKPCKIEILTSKKDKFPKVVKAYPLFDWLFSSYKQIDENKTLFTQVHLVDAGGWMTPKGGQRMLGPLLALLANQRGEGYKKSLDGLMEKIPLNKKISDVKNELKVEGKLTPFDTYFLGMNIDFDE